MRRMAGLLDYELGMDQGPGWAQFARNDDQKRRGPDGSRQ